MIVYRELLRNALLIALRDERARPADPAMKSGAVATWEALAAYLDDSRASKRVELILRD